MGILTTVLSTNSITTPQHSFETRSTEPRHSTQHLPYLPLTYCAVVNAIVDVFCCFLFSLLSLLTSACIDIFFCAIYCVVHEIGVFKTCILRNFPFLYTVVLSFCPYLAPLMSVLPLKHIIVTLLSPSTIMPSKTTLGSFSVVHNCCFPCVRRPMPYILTFSAGRLVYPFLRPKTSCIAKKGPSPR